MKRFVKILSIFLIPIFLIGLTMEFYLRQIPNRFKIQKRFLDEHSKEIETLILGSSHSLYGINPDYIQTSTYNLSNISQTLDIDKKMLTHFGNDMSQLKQIVLRLSYTTLFENLEDGDEKWRLKNYEIDLDLDVIDDIRFQYEILSVGLKQNLKSISNSSTVAILAKNTTDKGWSSDLKDRKQTNLEQSGKTAALKHTTDDLTSIYQNVQHLEEIVQWCKTRGIQVILVTLPAYGSYYENLDAHQKELTVETGEKFAKKFDNCRYYNFLTDSRFDSADFYDGDHLNKKGAEKFSKVLNELLNH